MRYAEVSNGIQVYQEAFWRPGTQYPTVDTWFTLDVSGASYSTGNVIFIGTHTTNVQRSTAVDTSFRTTRVLPPTTKGKTSKCLCSEGTTTVATLSTSLSQQPFLLVLDSV
ncbi:hypothetical protein L2E82_25324 [Cichorium intybus]|uniref:Uncharacterized protein n=1 Tax=Cichorium intybus TaxID=13427 RepID=A0ACB9E3H6_CICIN|nr:hypothetical protein L2E82_25324 [Cichorium intybus]